MKKTIITYTSRKTNKVYTFDCMINDGTTAVLIDSEGEKHMYALSTLKKNYKKAETEVEVEEPKTEEKSMTKHQKRAIKNIRHGYNWVIGGLENSVQDGQMDELPPIEEMFEEVYTEVHCCTFDEGFCDSKAAPFCMRFAGKAFVRQQIAKLFREDGYKVPENLLKVPEKQKGHSNFVDGERVNLRIDDADKVVTVRAFTGMLIGTFKVEKETKNCIIVKTHKGKMKFDKHTGIQMDAEKPKFANRIDVE